MAMDPLDELEQRSIYIIREGYYRFKKLALLWSIGKDSTTLLWLCRKAFFGTLPFPVLHIDTSYKFKEMYEFRKYYSKEWGLDLLICRNDAALADGMNNSRGVINCCGALKTEALKMALAKHQLDALFLGIRRDEHGIRAKERYFSPRNADFQWEYQDQPAEFWEQFNSGSKPNQHMRIHPLLHWSELDIWRYIKREKIPVVDLYFARENKRCRSIGCQPCSAAISSPATTIDAVIAELETSTTAERAGRALDKETEGTMQKLRSLGYM